MKEMEQLKAERDTLHRRVENLVSLLADDLRRRNWLEMEKAELAGRLEQKEAEAASLRQVLHDIYPMIAGHAINLEKAGETVAHAQWAAMAKKVYEAEQGGADRQALGKRDDIPELRRQLAAYEEAAREAVESSVPYITRFNAFLISAEAWHKLALLVCPGMSALDKLLCRLAAGEKLSEEEIREVLESRDGRAKEI